jgi:hypothetical protein
VQGKVKSLNVQDITVYETRRDSPVGSQTLFDATSPIGKICLIWQNRYYVRDNNRVLSGLLSHLA